LNSAELKKIFQIRKQITDFFLITIDEFLEKVYFSDVGKAHQILLDSGINEKTLTDTEQAFSKELLVKVSRGFNEPKAINYLLAAMLYYRADQLPLEPKIPGIPQWLLDDYLKFLFKVPGLFQECGEVESYYQYMQRWVDYIHINIFSNPESELWQRLAFEFTGTNFIPLYFSWTNLRDIYTKRADIIEFALKTNGHQIDYEFPEPVFNREKIRLGVLNGHFNPQTETFLTLPAFEYLDRNKFEIILYAIDVNGHPLEQYCQSRVDRLVKLPDNLPSQVHTIRADDLDILLIGTNVTAVTNAITLLVLHRLARVQATLYSSPVTTGMRNVDYYISGNLTEPVEGAQEHYREQLITLDGTGYCFNYNLESAPSPNKPNRKKLGISEQSVVFISGSNFYKIIPELRETWAKIIAAVPDSVLVLYPFSPSWSSSYAATSFVNRMHTVFSKYGIEKSRLLVLDSIPIRADVKEYLRLGDVYLDSYPYTGSFSTSDPLEVGLPPVVMDGNTLRSRQGPALLRELQMPDLIADSELSYIQLAVALGTNPELRKLKSNQIKHKMERNPRFLDSRSYSAQIGTLVQQLFRNHLAADLSNKLPLRDFNLIIFPDWSQPEDSLSQDLARVIRAIATHPDRSYMTLLIDTSNISDEEANLVVSGVAMNLLMEEDLDITERAEISLIGNLSEICWEALLPHLHARIVLENENEQASAKARVDTLPSYKLDSFSNTQIGKN
jgi:predicted O-linked N-acetylglucosamine transferase (SPINDLY family)